MGLYNKILKENYSNAGLIVKGYLRGRIILFDFKKVLDFVPKNAKKIVDIGCGYGFLDFMFVHKFKNTSVMASDLNSKRINFLKKVNKSKKIKFQCTDATNSKMDADVIICIDLLHHISYDAQEKLLDKIYKNSPKNATILIKDMDNPKYSVSYLVSYFIDIISAKQYPIFFRDRGEFVELFNRKGFNVKKMAYVNRKLIPLNHIMFVLNKKAVINRKLNKNK